MNKFTHENTKDAELIKTFGNQPGFEFYKTVSGAGYLFMSENTGFKWAMSVSAILNAVKLSRPHNETREFWTDNNGFVKYAFNPKPASNEMDTSKLIPIDFSRNITPAVSGDDVYNSQSKKAFTLNSHDVDMIAASSNNAHLFVVSFADRPNTGKQPVGDDVVVDCYVTGAGEKTRKAGAFGWSPTGYTGSIETWKPNHAAMLKQWQVEQVNQEQTKAEVETEQPKELNEEYLNSCSRSHLLMFSIDMLAQTKYQQGVIDELTSAKYQAEQLEKGVHIDADGDSAVGSEKVGVAAPVFTQAMADAGELPPVDTDCLFSADDKWTKCKYIGLNTVGSKTFAVCWSYEREEYVNTKLCGSGPIIFKPIQTDEDKLRDAINELWDAAPDKWATIEAILDNDKFTIKLKSE